MSKPHLFNFQMQTSWIYETDSLWIVAILIVVMLLVSEVGNRLGRRLHPEATDASRSHFLAVKGSLLGLLALLLAFTFNLASQRNETRQHLVVDEANLLHSLYLRSTLLPEPQQGQFEQLLRQYVDVRVSFFASGRDLSKINDALVQSDDLQTKMWQSVKSMSEQEPPVHGTDAMLQILSDEWTLQRDRLYAFENRVPDPVIILVLGCSIVAMGAVGVSAGLAKHNSIIARLCLALVLAGTIHIILDLDRPRRGLVKVSQEPMENLQQTLSALPKTGE
jgi:hypothetical protein